ncbi:MAG: radical SAM protein [Candidatus Diapherotrites archaeon]|nr:radical SAM protein [Candidatus Diapherotrites archaeon]
MKVILATPPQENDHTNDAIQLPLNIGYLSEYLKQKGVQVITLDAYGLKMSNNELVSKIIKENPDLVGFSGVIPRFQYLKSTVDNLRKKWSKPIVVGGPIVMIGPSLLDKLNVDYLIRGEGEYSLYDLLLSIKENKGFEKVKGLIYKKNGQIVENLCERINDLNIIPFPKYECLPLEQYTKFKLFNKTIVNPVTIITSRGCPAHCIFCCRYHGNLVRLRTAEHIIPEIEYWVKEKDCNEFNICDSTFTLNKQRVMEFCDLIADKKVDIKWTCQSRVNTIDKQMVKKMKETGCKLIYYGVESGSQRVLDYLKKGITIEKVKDVFEMTRKQGMGTLGSFIVGTPTETKKELKETLSLVKTLPIDFYLFSIFKPYPGTEAFEILKSKNVKITEDYTLFGGHNMVFDGSLPEEYLKNIVKELYYIQAKKVLQKLKTMPKFSSTTNAGRVSWFGALETYINTVPDAGITVTEKEICEFGGNIYRWNNTYFIYLEILSKLIFG